MSGQLSLGAFQCGSYYRGPGRSRQVESEKYLPAYDIMLLGKLQRTSGTQFMLWVRVSGIHRGEEGPGAPQIHAAIADICIFFHCGNYTPLWCVSTTAKVIVLMLYGR